MHVHNNSVAATDAIEALLALEITREQTLQIIGALAYSIAEATSVDYEVVDSGLFGIPEEAIDLCIQLSEKQKLQLIKTLASRLAESNHGITATT